MSALVMDNTFRFEEDFVEDGIRCIPMLVRFKLDRCGIKVRLSEWSRMNEMERRHLAESPCETPDEVVLYRSWLQHTIYERTGGEATELTSAPDPLWNLRSSVPACVREKLHELALSMTLAQWTDLSTLQRYALVKLCRPGHENRNFPIAIHEFLGAQQA